MNCKRLIGTHGVPNQYSIGYEKTLNRIGCTMSLKFLQVKHKLQSVDLSDGDSGLKYPMISSKISVGTWSVSDMMTV
jgi:hypothetical protein